MCEPTNKVKLPPKVEEKWDGFSELVDNMPHREGGSLTPEENAALAKALGNFAAALHEYNRKKVQ